MTPSVNLAVCGKFHYHNYVRYIDQSGALKRFFYAHRRSTDAAYLGVDPHHAVNVWIKEYLLHAHQKLLGLHGQRWGWTIYHRLWEDLVLWNWRRCDVFHFMLHGTCRRIIAEARRQGSVVLGEPVNTHPRTFVDLLNEEHERLGLAQRLSIDEYAKRLEEIHGCDFILAGSQFIRRSYADNGFSAGKIHVIPYGVDLQYFYPLSEVEARDRDAKFRVICVAQITPRKGHVYLLEAWKQLALPQAELLFIGSLHDEMKPTLAKYEGLFRHVPFVPNRELRQHYGRSDVFVLPSVEDGFAYVCTEAMGCGLPVITTHNTGAAGVIDEGRDGFIVPIRSPETIAQKLELLYRDKRLRREMGRAAHVKSQAALRWDTYAERLLKLYRELGEHRACASATA